MPSMPPIARRPPESAAAAAPIGAPSSRQSSVLSVPGATPTDRENRETNDPRLTNPSSKQISVTDASLETSSCFAHTADALSLEKEV